MEAKRQIEILKLMITKLGTDKEKKFTCICDSIFGLDSLRLITSEEKDFMLDMVRDNKPTPNNIYSKYTKGEYWIDRMFWWESISEEAETKQIRIDFINDLISNIK